MEDGLFGCMIVPSNRAGTLFFRRQVSVDLIQGEVAIGAASEQGLGPGKETFDGFCPQMFFKGFPERLLVVEQTVQPCFIERGNGLTFEGTRKAFLYHARVVRQGMAIVNEGSIHNLAVLDAQHVVLGVAVAVHEQVIRELPVVGNIGWQVHWGLGAGVELDGASLFRIGGLCAVDHPFLENLR